MPSCAVDHLHAATDRDYLNGVLIWKILEPCDRWFPDDPDRARKRHPCARSSETDRCYALGSPSDFLRALREKQAAGE